MPPRRTAPALLLGACLLTAPTRAGDEPDRRPVGLQPDGTVIVPTNQVLTPAGNQVLFPGRPVDLLMLDGGRTLVVKSNRGLVVIDTATTAVRQTLAASTLWKDRPGFSVTGLAAADGERVLATDSLNHVRVARRKQGGEFAWESGLALAPPKKGAAYPAGVVPLDADHVGVLSSRGNTFQVLGRADGKLEQTVALGVAPFQVLAVGADRLYVSNWGGDRPAGGPEADSSGTPIRIDPRTGVANHGSVSVLRQTGGAWQAVKSIPVGLHPSGLAASAAGRFVYVANATSDTVSVIDTRTDAVVETIACRPEARLPFGSAANALAVSPDGGTLYVANGTNNCLAVVRLGRDAREQPAADAPDRSRLTGLIPTGWYPGAVSVSPDGQTLFVANVKGHGSLDTHRPTRSRPTTEAHNSHDHLGTVSVIPVPDDAALAIFTEQVNANNRLAVSLAGLERPRPGVAPVPVPRRHGEPSVFEHVVYVIKENRTYDQLLGDMKEGNGDPKLCIFGETVTPNHHALSREFTLFDNFYCSGVLSADGHSWVTEAYVTDYLERAFGGFTRSYPDDGSDPLAYAPTGFLWDNALAHKKTIRNYGEFIANEYIPKTATWSDVYADFTNGTRKVIVKAEANVPGLAPFTHPGYPWFPLMMPDVYRAKLFLDDLKEFERKGSFPNLVLVTLPCDHTDGTKVGYPTPRAMVADNDLALGRVVEGLTHSRFWPKMCIVVVEDDPQDGFDHVDAHRTFALAISPYTKRKHVDSTCYTQTGLVKTIELQLGLPPMNQMDLLAVPLVNCFTEKPDLTPYKARPAGIKLDEMNPSLRGLSGSALHWAKKSMELDLEDGDKADEDTLNRILWHSVRGDEPYPERAGRE